MSASAFGPLVDAHLKAERRRAKAELFAYLYGADDAAREWAGPIVNRAGEVGLTRALAEAGPRPKRDESVSRTWAAAGRLMADAMADGIADTLDAYKASVEAELAAWAVLAAPPRVPITWELAAVMAEPTRQRMTVSSPVLQQRKAPAHV